MMSMNKREKILRDYDREMLRSAFSSLFWAVISRKKTKGLTLSSLAEKLHIHKSAVSRWFSGKAPNWELNSIADIAAALDVDVRVSLVDRADGFVYTDNGQEFRSDAVRTVNRRQLFVDQMSVGECILAVEDYVSNQNTTVNLHERRLSA